MTPPATMYAKAGDLHIAYQVVGDGPIDLVFVPSWFSHVEVMWQEPLIESLFQSLAAFSRLIIFDARGTGMSDPVPLSDPPTLEERMDDVLAVMNAAGSDRAAIFGAAMGSQLAAVFAASHPERACGIVLFNASARYMADDDYDIGADPEVLRGVGRGFADLWGRQEAGPLWARSAAGGAVDRLRTWIPTYMRLAMSPGAASALYSMNLEVDIRAVLPSIAVPTLVMHRTNNSLVSTKHGRYVADHIRGSRYVESPGTDSAWFMDDMTPVVAEIEEFLTGARQAQATDRVLATVMFTDIVRSTEIAAEAGDKSWRDTLAAHDALVGRQLQRFQGRLIKTTGDGVLATFDGPARAIRCAVAISEAVRNLGLEVRAGLHTGEIEVVGEDVAGIGVNLAARVMSEAQANEVLVSSTVQDLVVGSAIAFEDRGPHELKGIPGTWRLAVVAG